MFNVLFNWTALDRIVEILDEDTIFIPYNNYRASTRYYAKVQFVLLFVQFLINIAVYVGVFYGRLTTSTLIQISIFALCFESIMSYVQNKYLFMADDLLAIQVIPQIITTLRSKGFSSEIIQPFTFSTSILAGYYLKLVNIVNSILDIIIVIALMALLAVTGKGAIIVPFFIVYILVMVIAGYFFRINMKSIADAIINKRKVSNSAIAVRIFSPFVSNAGQNVIVRYMVPYAIISQHYEWLLLLFTVFGRASTLWESLYQFERLSEASTEMQRALTMAIEVSDMHIVNNCGYLKQKRKCSSSKKNSFSGIYLDKFAPILHKQKHALQHTYTFNFYPGVYQLMGANGVGKTTLLKALTLPDNYLTSFSSGKVSFDGMPFYTENNLKQHRVRSVYIGHLSLVPAIRLLEAEEARKYPLIAELHEHVRERNPNSPLSEGEQNVILIYHYFSVAAAIGARLVAVDEALSRIYDGKDKPLRTEVMRFICDMTKNNAKLVTIIVDHQTQMKRAIKLLMTRTEINPL